MRFNPFSRWLSQAIASLCLFGIVAQPAPAQVDPNVIGLQGVSSVQGDEYVPLYQDGARKAASVDQLLIRSDGFYAPPGSLSKWRKCRSQLLTGAVTVCRAAFVGDSKTFGAGAGAGAQYTNGAFPFARPARVAARLAASGVPIRTDSWFGAGGMGTIAAVLAYDTRRTGFSSWTGGSISLGGGALATSNTNPGNFQPSKAVDRVSVFYVQTPSQGTFTVAKGAESFTINAANATTALIRAEVTFATKDANPIVITRTTGGFVNIVGEVAWDSAAAGVEVANFGIYGSVTSYMADTTSVYSPGNALAVYAPVITIINAGTNDLAQGVSLASWLTSMQLLITTAKASGDCMVEWPTIASTSIPASGNGDAPTRRAFRVALFNLAVSNGCGYVDDSQTLTDPATALANGAFGDAALHEAGWAYDAEAAPIARALAN